MSSNFILGAGDINYKEYGGVLVKKENINSVEFIIFDPIGDYDSEHGIKLVGSISLDDLLERLNDVWEFADGSNCGFTIAEIIRSSFLYSSHIRECASEMEY
jgi:hypothetical protein